MSSSEEHSSDLELEDVHDHYEKEVDEHTTEETSAETDVEAGKDLTPRTKEDLKASTPLNRSRVLSGMENAAPLKGEKGGDQSRSCWQTTLLPFRWFGRKYARVRDWIIKTFFSFAILTTPILGPLTWHWWSIDINILELLCVSGIFAAATVGGSGSDYGIATGIMTCLVLLPVARNNFIKYMFGIPFEKMIKYHRWAGYYLMVPLSMHAIMEGGFIDDYTDITGTVAWIAAGLMLITSFYLFRRYKFEFFWLTHFLFLVYIGASIAHKPLVIGFVVPGGIMYGIDVILRLLRYWTRSSKAVSVIQYDESMCKIEVPRQFNYKAGQYAFVLVPRVSRLQWHPISFSSAPQEQTMSFHIRDLGSWSRGINRLSEDDPCTIKVDGPYGKVGIPYKKYKVLALFAAGAGVTPMMSVLKDIYLRRQMNQRCKVEKVYFYWSAGKAGAIEWFAEDLAFMAQHPLENLDLQMNIYVARMNKLHIQSESAQQVPLSKGRNDIKSNFKSLKEENKGETVGVLICGPKRFDYEVRKNCLIQSWTWPWTTKFHYHHETFAF